MSDNCLDNLYEVCFNDWESNQRYVLYRSERMPKEDFTVLVIKLTNESKYDDMCSYEFNSDENNIYFCKDHIIRKVVAKLCSDHGFTEVSGFCCVNLEDIDLVDDTGTSNG